MIPKFRAWDKVNKEMLEVEHIDFVNETVFLRRETEIFTTWLELDFSNVVLMQSTGLHDKNGKEIFEGDILRVWIEDEYIPNRDSGGGIIDYDCESGFSQIGKVEFEGSSFDYSTVKTLSGKHEEIYLPIGWLSNYEVLGNIHEHSYFLYKNEKGDY